MDRPGRVDPLIGRLLDRRYLVGARIARGGMASVYEATDLRLDRTVAVKVMPHTLAEDADFSQRFVREARAAARLTHPNVVTVYDQGDDDGVVFLAMEYVDGRHTLRDVIRDEAPLSPRRTLALLEEILKAIAVAHESGIIHRDIKPENVLIDSRGQLKVADFGLARAISASSTATATSGVLMGTVSYLPPELVTDGTADARSDVYALGVLTYEMLTGTKPHAGDSPIQVAYKHVHNDVPAPSSMVGGIPSYLDAFVARATSRQRDPRPADASVMLHQLRRVRHALDHGVVDDQELTDDLTPTVALRTAATGSGTASTMTSAASTVSRRGSSEDDVFDFAASDDFSVDGGGPGPDFVPAAERTLVGGVRPPGTQPGVQAAANGAADPSRRATVVDNHSTAVVGGPAARRSRRRGWIAFVVVLLLATGAALAGWYYGVGRFRATPDVVQLSQARAAKTIEAVGLTFKVSGSAYSETVPAGRVVSTDPGPGDDVLKAGGTVSAVVSNGPERHRVPDLLGLSETDAIKKINDTFLSVGPTTREWSETVKVGDVISFAPAVGTQLRRDDPVRIVVSRGPRPIDIHDHAGDEATAARRELSRLGFDVSTSRQYDDKVAKGLVISQRPDHGIGHSADRITLVVSRGPHLVQVPDVYHFGISDAESALADKGFSPTIKHFEPYLGLGFVVGQSPGAGETAPYGSTIVLTVV